MSEQQVARVYAEALFQAASGAGTVKRTGGDLRSFTRAVAESPALANVLFNPQIEPEAKLRVVTALTAAADKLAAGALTVLLDKGRIGVLGEVADGFESLAAAAAKVVDVELTTAVPVEPAVEERIVARIERSTGMKARLRKHVDPAILGGLVLRIGDVIIDGSLRSRIRQLGKRLQSAEVRGGDQ